MEERCGGGGERFLEVGEGRRREGKGECYVGWWLSGSGEVEWEE